MKRTIIIAVIALMAVSLGACRSTGGAGPVMDVRAGAQQSTPAGGVKALTFIVPDANCASTSAEAYGILSAIDGVSEVSMDMEKASADLKADLSRTSIEAIKKALSDAGYPVTGVLEID